MIVQYVAGLCFITRHPAFEACVDQVVQHISGGGGGSLSEETLAAGLKKAFVDLDDTQVNHRFYVRGPALHLSDTLCDMHACC